MICPKCGFAQEERVDCIKCGVVFAKFYALYSPDGPAGLEAQEFPDLPPAPFMELGIQDLSEMRQTLRDLTRRFNELDFERIERGRMRNDLRALEQTVEEGMSALVTQQDEQGRQLSALAARPAGVGSQELDELRAHLRSGYVEPLSARAERLERRLDEMQSRLALVSDTSIPEILRKMDRRQIDLEARLAAMEAGESKGDSAGPASGIAEIVKQVEEVRGTLDNVTVRYSEIGEIKKNHLVLSSRVDTLQSTLEKSGPEALAGLSRRIAEIDREVMALRAEVRQALERVERLAVAGPPAGVEPLKEEVAMLARMRLDESEKMRSALAALDCKL
ncbi:MAG: hypothetical protein ABIG68_07955, partial [Acidobacteriota bacterium]